MPERSFGRTVRYRRTKVGLSQAKLAELVGRSAATIRSWERDQSRPNDPNVLAALSAILGVEERHLFDKADVERPAVETSPTVEQALATLSVQQDADVELDRESEHEVRTPEPTSETEMTPQPTLPVSVRDYTFDFDDEFEDRDDDEDEEPERPRELAGSVPSPSYVAPPEIYQQTPLTPTLADASYIEDVSQRQVYRVRTLATLVAVVVMIIAFIWAVGEGLGALDAWWEDFFGNLRL